MIKVTVTPVITMCGKPDIVERDITVKFLGLTVYKKIIAKPRTF